MMGMPCMISYQNRQVDERETCFWREFAFGSTPDGASTSTSEDITLFLCYEELRLKLSSVLHILRFGLAQNFVDCCHCFYYLQLPCLCGLGIPRLVVQLLWSLYE